MRRSNSQVRNSRVQSEPIAANPVRKSGMCDKLCKCLKQKCCCKNTETPEEAMENFQQNVNIALEQVFLNDSDQSKVGEDKSEHTSDATQEVSNQQSRLQDFEFNMDWSDSGGKVTYEKCLPRLSLAMGIKDSLIAFSISRGYFVQWNSKSLYLHQVKDDYYSEVQGFFPMKMEPDMTIYLDRSAVTFSTNERRLIILTNKGVVVSDNFDEPLPFSKMFTEKSPSRGSSGLKDSKQIKVQAQEDEDVPLEQRASIPPASVGLYNMFSQHAPEQPVPQLPQMGELDDSPEPSPVRVSKDDFDDYPYKLVSHDFGPEATFPRVFFLSASFGNNGYGDTNTAREEYIDPRPKFLLITFINSETTGEIIFVNIDNVLRTVFNNKDSNDRGSKLSRENNYGVEVVKPGGYWGRDGLEKLHGNIDPSRSSTYYSRQYEAAYIVTTEDQYVTIEAYYDNLSLGNKSVRELFKTTYKKKPMNIRLFYNTRHCAKGLLLVSEPVSKIYLLSFNIERGLPLKEIITLPTKIKKINNFTFDDHLSYIFVNADDGDLYVWAKMRDKSYGIIYYSKLESEHTKLYVAHDCRYIFQVTGNQMKALMFAPFMRPLVQSIDCEQLTKENILFGKNYRVGSKYLLSFNSGTLTLVDMYSTEAFDLYTNDDSENTVEDVDVWNFNPRKSEWIIQLQYLKRSQDSNSRIKVFDFYHLELKQLEKPRNAGRASENMLKSVSSTKTSPTSNSNFNFMLAIRIHIPKESTKLVARNDDIFMFYCEENYSPCYWIYTDIKSKFRLGEQIKPIEVSHIIQLENMNYCSTFVTNSKRLLVWDYSFAPIDTKYLSKEEKEAMVEHSDQVVQNDPAINDSFDDLDVIENGPPIKISKVQEENMLKQNDLRIFDLDSLKKEKIENQSNSAEKPEEKIVPNHTIKICQGMNFLKVSPDSKYLFFYGAGGYQLMVKDNEGYSLIKRKVHINYKIDRENQAEFSNDSQYLIFSLPRAGKVMLVNFLAKVIKPTVITNCNKLSDYRITFEFIYKNSYGYNPSTDFPQKPLYLAITDYSDSLHRNKLKIFELRTMMMLNGGTFSNYQSPLYIDYYINENDKLEAVTLDITDGQVYDTRTDYSNKVIYEDNFTKGKMSTINRIRTYLHNSDNIPFYYFFRTNYLKYFKSQTKPQSEGFYFRLIMNIYKTIPFDTMFSDPRLFYSLYVLDKQGLIDEIFGGKTYLSILFTHQNLLQLMFNPSVPTRHYSIESVVKLFDDYTKQKKYPSINETYVRHILTSHNPNIEDNPGCRSILSFILFADCQVQVTGLVADKYRSAVGITPEQHAIPHLSKWAIESIVKNILVEKPSKTNDYQVFRTRVTLELTNGSEGSLGLFRAIMLMPDNEIRYKYRQLINLKWKMVFWYSFVYCMLYYILNILAYIYFAYYTKFGVGIAVIAFNILFILYDIKCFGSKWRIFLRDFNNWLDIIVHTVSIVSAILLYFNYISVIHPYARLAAITLISIRGITLLKMFGPLRMLVLLIGQIIADLFWVPIVLSAILALAATIYKVAPLPGGNTNSNLGFLESLQEVFFLIFMNSQTDAKTISLGSSDYGAIIRSIIIVLGGTLLAQGIFNFIIAIFVQTFKKVNDDREIYEIRGMILDIRDVDLFLRGFQYWMKPVESYFLFLVPIPKDGVVNENETEFEKATRMFNSMVAEVGKRGLKRLEKEAIEVLPGHEDKITAAIDAVSNQAPKTDPAIKALVDTTEKLATGGKVEMQDVKNIAQATVAVSSKFGKRFNSLANDILTIIQNESKDWESGNISSNNIKELLKIVQMICETIFPQYKLSNENLKILLDIVEVIPFDQSLPISPEDLIMKLTPKLSEVFKNDKVDITMQLLKLSGEIYSTIRYSSNPGEAIGRLINVFILINKDTSKYLDRGSARYLYYLANALEVADLALNMQSKYNLTVEDMNEDAYKHILKFAIEAAGCFTQKYSSGNNDSLVRYLRGIKAFMSFISTTIGTIEDTNSGKPLVERLIIKNIVEDLYAVVKEVYKPNSYDSIVDEICNAIDVVQQAVINYTKKDTIDIEDILKQAEPIIKNRLSDEQADIVMSIVKIIDQIKGIVEKKDEVINEVKGRFKNDAEKRQKLLETKLNAIFDNVAVILNHYITKDDQAIMRAVEKAQRIMNILIESIQNFNQTKDEQKPLEIAQSMANIVNILSPKLQEFSGKFMKCLNLVMQQKFNFQKGQVNLESFVIDTSEFMVIVVPSVQSEVKKVSRLSLIAVKHIEELRNSGGAYRFDGLSNVQCSRYVKCLGDITAEMIPSYKPHADLATELVALIETTVKDSGNNSYITIQNINNYIETIGKIVILYNKKYKPFVSQATKIARLLQNSSGHFELTNDKIIETVDIMADLFSNFDSRISIMKPVLLDSAQIIVEVKEILQNVHSLYLGKLFERAGNIITFINSGSTPTVLKMIAISKVLDEYLVAEKIIDHSKAKKAQDFLDSLLNRDSSGTTYTNKSVAILTAISDAIEIFNPKYEPYTSNVKLIVNSIYEIVLEREYDIYKPISMGTRAICNIVNIIEPKTRPITDKFMIVVDAAALETQSALQSDYLNTTRYFKLVKTIVLSIDDSYTKILNDVESIVASISNQADTILEGRLPWFSQTLESAQKLINDTCPEIASKYNVTCRLLHVLDLIIHKSQANDFSIDSLRLVVTETLTVIKLVRPVPPKFEDCIQAFFAEVEKRQHLFAMSKESFEVSPFLRTLLPFTAVLEPNTRACIGATVDLLEAIEVYAETGDLPSAAQSAHLSRVLLESILRIKPETQRFVSTLQPLLKTAEIVAGLTDKSSQDLRTEHLLDAAIDIFRIVKTEYIPNSMKARPVFTLLDKQIEMHRRGAPMQAVELIEDIRDAAVIVSPSYAEKVRLVADVAVISIELCMSGVQDDFSPTRLLCPLIDLATLSLPERKADAEVVKSYLTVLESQIRGIVEGDMKNVFAVVRELHKLLTRVDPEMGEKLKDMPTVVDTCELSAAFMSDPSEEMLVETLKIAGTIYFRSTNIDQIKLFDTFSQLLQDCIKLKSLFEMFKQEPIAAFSVLQKLGEELIEREEIAKQPVLKKVLDILKFLLDEVKDNKLSIVVYIEALKRMSIEDNKVNVQIETIRGNLRNLHTAIVRELKQNNMALPVKVTIGSEDTNLTITLEVRTETELFIVI